MKSNYLMMGLLEGFFFYIFLTENDENATVFNFIYISFATSCIISYTIFLSQWFDNVNKDPQIYYTFRWNNSEFLYKRIV